jgi:hypothetical protein
METTDKKQNPSGGDQQQTAGDTTNSNKAWWEQFTGAIPSDKDSLKSLTRLLSNPLTAIISLLVLGYLLFTQKQAMEAKIAKEMEHLNREIKRLKKKQKKLNRIMNAPDSPAEKRFAVMD